MLFIPLTILITVIMYPLYPFITLLNYLNLKYTSTYKILHSFNYFASCSFLNHIRSSFSRATHAVMYFILPDKEMSWTLSTSQVMHPHMRLSGPWSIFFTYSYHLLFKPRTLRGRVVQKVSFSNRYIQSGWVPEFAYRKIWLWFCFVLATILTLPFCNLPVHCQDHFPEYRCLRLCVTCSKTALSLCSLHNSDTLPFLIYSLALGYVIYI